jgi:hypothetical protein
MKKYVVVLMLLSMAVVALPAHANYICSGNLTTLIESNGGTIWIGGPGGTPGGMVLCTLGTTSSNGFTPDSCRAAYATLLAANLSGRGVALYFNDNLTCSTQTGWGNNTPVSIYAVQMP